MQRLSIWSLVLWTCLTLGCGWIGGGDVPNHDDADGGGSTNYDDSGLHTAKRGIDLEALTASLPSDMRENLGRNDLRRKRANEWLAANAVGKTLEIELTVQNVDAVELPKGKRWIRVWLEEPATTILGEEMLLSAGPGFSPDAPLFGGSSGAGLEGVVLRTLVFGDSQPNPSYAVLEAENADEAEKLLDLRGKKASLRGAIRHCEFYPSRDTLAGTTTGGLLIRMADATLNDMPFVAGVRVSDEPTNPWGIAYEPILVGDDMRRLLENAKLDGGANDPNAADWTPEPAYVTSDSLEGQWFGRWKSGDSGEWHVATQPVDAVVKDGRLMIRFIDDWGTNLIVLRKESDDLYAGRYLIAEHPLFCSPIAARVVSNERIDGAWINDAGEVSRWDFRRKLHLVDTPLQDFLESTTPAVP